MRRSRSSRMSWTARFSRSRPPSPERRHRSCGPWRAVCNLEQCMLCVFLGFVGGSHGLYSSPPHLHPARQRRAHARNKRTRSRMRKQRRQVMFHTSPVVMRMQRRRQQAGTGQVSRGQVPGDGAGLSGVRAASPVGLEGADEGHRDPGRVPAEPRVEQLPRCAHRTNISQRKT